jgi:hypothetical protein
MTDISAHRPLRVAVLVTLERGPAAGGHVKSWERIAEVAAKRPDLIELDQVGALRGRLGDPLPALHMAAGGGPAFESDQHRNAQRSMG